MMISDCAVAKACDATAASRLSGAVIGLVAFTDAALASPEAAFGAPAAPVAAAQTIAARAKLARTNGLKTTAVLMLGLATSEGDVCLVAGPFKAASKRCESLTVGFATPAPFA